jgi:hypothetical protein
LGCNPRGRRLEGAGVLGVDDRHDLRRVPGFDLDHEQPRAAVRVLEPSGVVIGLEDEVPAECLPERDRLAEVAI